MQCKAGKHVSVINDKNGDNSLWPCYVSFIRMTTSNKSDNLQIVINPYDVIPSPLDTCLC